MGEAFPVGQYSLEDGRIVVGLDEFQLRASARESWRRQAVADERLALRLAAQRRTHAAPGTVAGTVGDLGGPIAGLQMDLLA